MKKNIFEGAKFGDKFVTKNGKIARFICTNNKNNSCLYINGRQMPDGYFPNGKYVLENKNDWDIISRYQEPIDEDELDELSTIECSNNFIGSDDMADIVCNITDDFEQASIDAYMIGFKAGYRKAKDE